MASLVADYGTSGSEDGSSNNGSSDSESELKSDYCKAEDKKYKLPPPSFSSAGTANPVSNSVFVNPYVEAENTKMAVLEKHVKMVPQKKMLSSINGKKVCWMYRKGRCRFGHTCKFAHDSDLINPTTGMVSDDKVPDSLPVTANSLDPMTESVKRAALLTDSTDPDVPVKKKKKKPGLAQGLVPGKKVLKGFKKSNDLLAP